jgi:ATP-dependent Clp protease ATP-binding subunit ClpA
MLGLQLNCKFFFSPIFGDRTAIGRLLTLILRSSVIVIGSIVFAFIAITLFLLPILWFLAFPLLIISPAFLLLPLFGLIYYLVFSFSQPEYLIPYKNSSKDINFFADSSTKKLINQAEPNTLIQELIKNPSVIHFLQRILLNGQLLIGDIGDKKLQSSQQIALLNKISSEQQIRQIRPVHIFYELLIENSEIFDIPLKKQQLDIDLIKKYIDWEEFEYKLHNPPKLWDQDYKTFTGGGSNRTWQGTVTPLLNQYCEDLTAHSYQNDRRVVRFNIINQIQQALQKNQTNNVLLVGDIGVGKDTLVQEIAQAIATGHIQGQLWSKRIVKLDTAKLYATSVDQNDSFESRVQNILTEINRSGNIILYLNDFNSAIQTQNSGKISLFALLQQSVSSGNVRIIGAITPREYHSLETTAASFLNQFTTINVPETDLEETTHILHNESLISEMKDGLFFPFPSIESIYKYSLEYFQQDAMPQRAIKLLESVTASVHDRRNDETQVWQTIYGKKIPVLNHTISQVINELIHVPVGEVEKNEATTLLNMESLMQKFLIDQTEAVSALSKALRRNRAGLRNKNKPIGSFLFVGPTGVGKTEMAKTLARIYYGSEKNMFRFDMSEFKELQSIERLIGSPQGTSVLTLTEQVKKQPFSLILLDELEKAHPQILDLFLQVLDDGILTDGLGQTVRFNEAIIIATSNANTQEITQMFRNVISDKQYSDIKNKLPQLLSSTYRIEFLNRFDELILFKPLTQQSIEKIVKMQLEKISDTVYQEKKIQISFSESTIKNLVKNGYVKELGARPLQREIQDTLESKIAILLLKNTLQPGESITL